MLSSYVFAENVVLDLKDPITDKSLEDTLVNIETDGNEEKIFVQSGKLELTLDKGGHTIIITVDYQNTDGKDYYEKIEIIVDESMEKVVYLTRTASLRGSVKDELDNLIKNAQLRFECAAYSDYPAKSDNIGFFSAPFVPVGDCEISATYGNKAGSEKIKLEHGKLYEDVEIVLNKKVYSKGYYTKIIISALIVIGIIFYLIYFEKKKVRKQRMQAIISTLNEKERKVTELLLRCNEASQTRLCKDLEVPKTTMIRLLNRLEEKKIINVKRLGRKYKNVRISDSFLGKNAAESK